MYHAMKLLLSLCLLLTSCTILEKKEDKPKIKIHQKKHDIDYQIDRNLKKIASQEAKNIILLLLPLSGDNAKIGRGILNSCLLATNERGDSNIDLVVVDTADINLDKNQLCSQFRDKKLKAIIGPVFSNEARKYGALFPNIPIFTFSNDLKVNNNHVFACGLSPKDEIDEIFSYAVDLKKIKSFLVLLPNGSYGDEILNYIKSALKRSGTNYLEDERKFEVIRYGSLSKEEATQRVKQSGKKAVFVVDPILEIGELGNIQVFTLSSQAISDKEAWRGSIFAFAENERLSEFKKKYRFTFWTSPIVLDIIGYDILNAIYKEILLDDFDILNKEFDGCLGKFSIGKNRGLKRSLDLFEAGASEE